MIDQIVLPTVKSSPRENRGRAALGARLGVVAAGERRALVRHDQGVGPDGGLRLGRRGVEQAERAEQQREDGEEGEAVRGGRGPARRDPAAPDSTEPPDGGRGRGACGRARRGRKDSAPERSGGSGAPGVRSGRRGQAPGPAGAPAQGAAVARLGSARLGSARLGSARLGSARLGSARLGSARLGSARLGSARLGSARLGSARLGSARLGSARLGSALNCTGRSRGRCQALVRHIRHTGNVLPTAPCEGRSARLAPPRGTKHRLCDGAAADLMSRHPHRPVLLLDADSRTRHAPVFPVRPGGSSISPAQSLADIATDCNTVAKSPTTCRGGRPIACLEYSFLPL